MITPLAAWQRLRAGNENAAMPVRGSRPELTDQPIAAIFSCSDAAATSDVIFRQPTGSLVDISTWGLVMDCGVLGTIEYAVEHLNVPLIVVLGHQNCLAMHAAMRAWTEGALPDGAARTAVEHAVASLVRRGSAADSVDSLAAAHVVDSGMALLERSRIIRQKVDAGTCALVCATVGADGQIRTHGTIGAVGETAEKLLECV